MMGMTAGGPYPRPIDETGPGMTAGDLDRMCRQHYLDGHASRNAEIRAMRDDHEVALADAFDEGSAAQDELNALRIWQAVRRRVDADLVRAIERAIDAIAGAGDSPSVVEARRRARDAHAVVLALLEDVIQMERGDGRWDCEANEPVRGYDASAVVAGAIRVDGS